MRILLLVGSVFLVACGNLSGLDGGSRYACAAPEGVACDSVSGTYANALQSRLPSQRPLAPQDPAPPQAPAMQQHGNPAHGVAPGRPVQPAAHQAREDDPHDGARAPALRSSARVLRLWTKPWEDADGDLWDQGRVYVQIDGGRWQIEHLHQRVRERYQPLRSPAAAAPEIGDPQTAASPATDSPSVTDPVSPPSPSFGDFPAFNRPLTLPVPRHQ